MHCTVKTFLQIVALLCLCNTANAQFAPAAGLPGTTAIAADSSIFVGWATGCNVQRGPMNIANASLGLASAGGSSYATGPSDGVTVSLGDGGTAVLTFAHPIFNGEGPDFAVFENGFMINDSNLAFLELGFVEVSTDGNRYIRFPATTNVQDTSQLNNDGAIDCSQLNNLAGKYIAHYGTPFDLQELVDSPDIDVDNINYVKIIDAVGSIDSAYATRDHNGRVINDPWPTPFASDGFDLDAVGAIHSLGASAIKVVANNAMQVFPNPVKVGSDFRIVLSSNNYEVKLYSVDGQMLRRWYCSSTQNVFNTHDLNSGVYFITAQTQNSLSTTKLVIE